LRNANCGMCVLRGKSCPRHRVDEAYPTVS